MSACNVCFKDECVRVQGMHACSAEATAFTRRRARKKCISKNLQVSQTSVYDDAEFIAHWGGKRRCTATECNKKICQIMYGDPVSLQIWMNFLMPKNSGVSWLSFQLNDEFCILRRICLRIASARINESRLSVFRR